MHKILLTIMIFGPFIAACGASITPASTVTTVPLPTSVPAPTLLKEIKLETQTGTAYALDWSLDGETLAAASGYEITLLNNDLSETLVVLKPEEGAISITWDPDEKQFATVNGYRNPTVTLWDWDSANLQLTLAQQIQAGSDQYGVFWSPDGKVLATLADDDKSTFQIWDTSTWEEIRKFDLPYTNPRRTFGWSADSSTLYGAGEANGQMVLFALNVLDRSVQEVAKLPVAQVEVFAFSPDAKKLVVADAQGVVQILDAVSGETLTGIKTVDQPVDLAWNPNGTTLAILGYKTMLQLWDVSE